MVRIKNHVSIIDDCTTKYTHICNSPRLLFCFCNYCGDLHPFFLLAKLRTDIMNVCCKAKGFCLPLSFKGCVNEKIPFGQANEFEGRGKTGTKGTKNKQVNKLFVSANLDV